MNIKSRKFIALILGSFIFCLMFFVTLLIDSDILNIIGIPIISAELILIMAYIGGVVWAGFIKSKYYRKELDV